MNAIEKVYSHLKQNELLAMSVCIVVISCCSLFFLQGINSNDDLQWRLMQKIGLWDLLNHALKASLRQGRAIKILSMFAFYFNSPNNNYYIGRGIQILLMLINSGLFSITLYRFWGYKYYAILSFVVSIAMLPVCHGALPPGKYVGYCCLPVLFFLLSLNAYYSFIISKKTKYIVFCSLLFFLSASGLESMLMLFPIYVAVSLSFENISPIQVCKRVLPIFISGLLYVTIYFGSQIIYPTQYSGNTINIESFGPIFCVIKALFLFSIIPGFYMYSPAYQHMFKIYSEFRFYENNLFLWFLENCSFELITFTLAGMIVFYYCLEKEGPESVLFKWSFYGFLLAEMVILTIPNAITIKSQEEALVGRLWGVPVNYPMFFLASLFLTSLFFEAGKRFNRNSLKILFVCGIVFVFSAMQFTNGVFARQQRLYYTRLITMESLFDTDVIKKLDSQRITSPDMYRRMGSLGFHKGYWSQFAKYKGLNIKVDSDTDKENEIRLLETQEGIWCVVLDNEYILLSRSIIPLSFDLALRVSDDKAIIVKKGEKRLFDHGFYCVHIKR